MPGTTTVEGPCVGTRGSSGGFAEGEGSSMALELGPR